MLKRKDKKVFIIPLREKIGNYDQNGGSIMLVMIIPLREKIGNYDSSKVFP